MVTKEITTRYLTSKHILIGSGVRAAKHVGFESESGASVHMACDGFARTPDPLTNLRTLTSFTGSYCSANNSLLARH